MNWFQKIINFFLKIFLGVPDKKDTNKTISHIPIYNEKSETVEIMQQALVNKGYGISVDGEFGPITKGALRKLQLENGLKGSGIPGPKTIKLLELEISTADIKKKTSKIPWFWVLKKYEGKSEHDSAFNKFMSGFWAKVGLPGFKSIVGSKRAWCGLFGAAGLIMTGYQVPVNSFRAKAWDTYCQKIEYKVNGIPQGAFLRINNNGDCDSVFNNHLSQANGDCAPKDIDKPGDVISAYGGNQGDRAKVSNYSMRKICAARWPCEEKLPGKVTKSVNCSNGKTADKESTR